MRVWIFSVCCRDENSFIVINLEENLGKFNLKFDVDIAQCVDDTA